MIATPSLSSQCAIGYRANSSLHTRESHSLEIGRGFARRLRLKCKQLASLPGQMGRARHEIGDGLRSSAYKGYIIFFRYVEDEFQIVNILEGHRDAAAHFGVDVADETDLEG